jgi:hypothetical protein
VDIFVFADNWGSDIVLDFQVGLDTLDLSGMGLLYADLSIGNGDRGPRSRLAGRHWCGPASMHHWSTTPNSFSSEGGVLRAVPVPAAPGQGYFFWRDCRKYDRRWGVFTRERPINILKFNNKRKKGIYG